jgi:hypothetical protein
VGDTRRSKRGRPLAVTKLLEVDVAASGGGEEERRVEPRGNRLERIADALAQGDAPSLPARLGAWLQAALRVDPLDGDDACLSIEVAAFERDPLFRPQSCPRREDRDGRKSRMNLCADRVHFLPGLERLDLRSLRLRVLDVPRRVAVDPLPAFRLLEHLAEGREDVMPRSLRKRQPPGAEFVGAKGADLPRPERGRGMAKLPAQLLGRRRVDVVLRQIAIDCLSDGDGFGSS